MSPPSVPPAFVWLASQSPRRRQLLDQIGVAHQPLLPGPEEDAEALEAVLPGERPQDYVQRVTALKLQAAVDRWRARDLPAAPVLVADTTVALGRRILGKPEDKAQAADMLRSLSDRSHRVHTAVALAVADARGRWRQMAVLSTSRVRMEALTEDRIAAYVASGEPHGKAGAYAIQGAAGAWIANIEGSHSGIMGLPLHETAVLLRRVGFHC